jgi:hypothetical protein
MSWGLNFQTGYALARCAFSFGKSYIPYSHLSHKVTALAQGLLLTCDTFNVAYAGWQINEEWQKKQALPHPKKRDEVRSFVDWTVNMALLAGVGALFVMGVNRYLVPTTSLPDLLKSTTIPQKTLEVIADQSTDHVTAVWTKTLMENLTTGLFFMRTTLDLGLAYLTRQPRHLFHAAIHAMTTCKTAQYCTLAIHHSFDNLLQHVDSSFISSKQYANLIGNYLSDSVKKVEAVFYINVEGLSPSALSDKIQAVYDYSSKMFHKSVWKNAWENRIGSSSFLQLYTNPESIDPSENLLRTFGLNYKVTLAGDPPPAPVNLRIFHEDTIWQPFQRFDIFQWIPRFSTPSQKIPFADWTDAKLTVPLTSADTFLTKVYSFFLKRR